jgi:NAD(P)-dependent dehydrogenase (short-subunit alcohol dehydrogenase family)
MSTRSFHGKVVLVTGGATGIGRAAAVAFARAGARVAIADVDDAQVEHTAHLVGAEGERALTIHADVSDATEVDRMVAQTVERFGRLDCAFNNAGISGALAAHAESTFENWERVIAVNLTGVWACMRAELRQMLAQGGGGSIVNTASVMGHVGSPLTPAYTASKHGVMGLTKSAAIAYAASGIRVNAVCPGYIDTPMIARAFEGRPEVRQMVIAQHPVGRLGNPEEIAEAVVWLCSEAASFVNGHGMAVDGGYLAR